MFVLSEHMKDNITFFTVEGINPCIKDATTYLLLRT